MTSDTKTKQKTAKRHVPSPVRDEEIRFGAVFERFDPDKQAIEDARRAFEKYEDELNRV